MVIEDIHSQSKREKISEAQSQHNKFHLADPMDRAAAFIVDTFIILLPILMLSSAPFKRIIFSSILLDNNLDFAFSIFFGVIISILTIVFYNSITTWLLGASLGKRFFGLRIVDVWTKKKPKLSVALLRAFSWWAGFFTFGFAFASIFTNSRRRALHDRISETMVVSEKYKAIGQPSIYESSIVKGVFSGFLAFVCVITLIIAIDTHNDLSRHNEITDILEENGGLCSAVGKAYREWPENIESDTPRMEVAMALFAAGNIGEECLEAEASFIFRQDIENGLAYLAKAFVHSNRAKLSDSYLQRVCEIAKDSNECQMSEIVKLWDDEDWEKINLAFVKVDSTWPVYIQIWSIRNAINQGDFIFAKNRLNEIPNIESLKNFKINFKTKAYVIDSGKEQLNSLTDLALSSLDESEKLNLSTWLCYQQASTSCDAFESKSCQYFINNYDKELLGNSLFALTATRKEHCEGGFLRNLENASRGVQKINQALNVITKNSDKGLEMLWSIYKNKSYKLKIREEAARYFLGKAQTPEAMDKLVILWKSRPHELEWQKTGQLLFKRLQDLQLFDKAAEVGESVLEHNENNENFKKNLALAFFKSGKHKQAWELISKNVNVRSSRAPASIGDEFEVMKESLKKEYLK